LKRGYALNRIRVQLTHLAARRQLCSREAGAKKKKENACQSEHDDKGNQVEQAPSPLRLLVLAKQRLCTVNCLWWRFWNFSYIFPNRAQALYKFLFVIGD